jgi:hypothetical protein
MRRSQRCYGLGSGNSPFENRLQDCGHVFCFECLVRLFETAASAGWFSCPVCEGPILDPPRPDERVEMAVRWLRLAEGDDVSDAASAPLDAFDIYFQT